MKLVDNVTTLPVITTLPLEAERILTQAIAANLTTAIVIGTDVEGSLYFASTTPDGGEVLWWMEKAKTALMEISK